jgi:undecaprenol kinase
MKKEWRRLKNSFVFAKNGLFYAISRERNLQIHLMFTCIVVPLALIFEFNLLKWTVLLLTIGIVISIELINTAIETTVDLITDEYHPLAEKAKDIGAAAVFFFSFIAVLIGLLLFLPPIMDTFK